MDYALLAQVISEGLAKHWPQLVTLGGMAILCYLLLRNNSQRARRERHKSDVDEIRELAGQRSRDSVLADAPDEFLRWQVEMHDTARDLKAELDSKILALQAVIREARAERERLEAALKQAGQEHP